MQDRESLPSQYKYIFFFSRGKKLEMRLADLLLADLPCDAVGSVLFANSSVAERTYVVCSQGHGGEIIMFD